MIGTHEIITYLHFVRILIQQKIWYIARFLLWLQLNYQNLFISVNSTLVMTLWYYKDFFNDFVSHLH